MDETEIRAEIERRRKRAIDLKLRETVWNIYSSQFQYMDDYLKHEPGLASYLYPSTKVETASDRPSTD